MLNHHFIIHMNRHGLFMLIYSIPEPKSKFKTYLESCFAHMVSLVCCHHKIGKVDCKDQTSMRESNKYTNGV